MGRAGIEPATLGLKVRPDSLQADARNGTCLHERAFQTATNCTEIRRYAARPYSQRAPFGLWFAVAGTGLLAEAASGAALVPVLS
jgi:hypothetical protein